MESLALNCLFSKTSVAAVSAATDITSGSIIDLGSPTEGGFDSVCFVASLGACVNGSVVTLKAYAGNAPALGDGVYLTETATVTATATAAFADNNLLILDVVKPGKRYVRADLTRATQAAVLDSIIAIRYNGRACPVTQPSGVADTGVQVN